MAWAGQLKRTMEGWRLKRENVTNKLHLCFTKRILEVYREYFWKFFNELPKEVQEKIECVLEVIITVDRIPRKFFKHVDDGIYEIRVERNSNIYRVFSFFDDGKLVILLHGIQKKTQKLPRKEIDRAKILRKMYHNDKEKSQDD